MSIPDLQNFKNKNTQIQNEIHSSKLLKSGYKLQLQFTFKIQKPSLKLAEHFRRKFRFRKFIQYRIKA